MERVAMQPRRANSTPRPMQAEFRRPRVDPTRCVDRDVLLGDFAPGMAGVRLVAAKAEFGAQYGVDGMNALPRPRLSFLLAAALPILMALQPANVGAQAQKS